jgi:hypothetical protein
MAACAETLALDSLDLGKRRDDRGLRDSDFDALP